MKNLILLLSLIYFSVNLKAQQIVDTAQVRKLQQQVTKFTDSLRQETDIEQKKALLKSPDYQQLSQDDLSAAIQFSKAMLDHFLATGDQGNSLFWLRKMENFGMFYRFAYSSWFVTFAKRGEYNYIDSYLAPKMDSLYQVMVSDKRLDSRGHAEYQMWLNGFVETKLQLQAYQTVYQHLDYLYRENKVLPDAQQYLQYTKVLIALGKEAQGIEVLATVYLNEINVNPAMEQDKNALLAGIDQGQSKFQAEIARRKTIEKENLNFLVKNLPELYGRGVKERLGTSKYLLLSFWGTWCVPCIQSHPKLKSIYDKYHDQGLEIWSIARENGTDKQAVEQKLKKSIADQELPWLHSMLVRGTERVLTDYDVTGYPTKILLDRQGNILGKFTGNEGDKIEAFVSKLLTQN